MRARSGMFGYRLIYTAEPIPVILLLCSLWFSYSLWQQSMAAEPLLSWKNLIAAHPPAFWLTIWTINPLLRLTAMFYRKPLFRRTNNIVALMTWTFTGITLAGAASVTIVTGFCFICSFCCLWQYVRLSKGSPLSESQAHWP